MIKISESHESPIEDIWAYHSAKYLSENVLQSAQVEVKTLCGVFRPDFIIAHKSGLSVAVECDGKEFHNEHRDEWRDAMILGDSKLQGILRFRGTDINYHVEDLLYLTAQAYPSLFSERGQVNLRQLASIEAKQFSFDASDTHWRIHYQNYSEEKKHRILIEHRHKNIPKGKRQFWQAAYKFAKSIGSNNLDALMYEYKKINQTPNIDSGNVPVAG